MTADGGCGVSWSYHYLRYCGKGKKAIISYCRVERGREEPCLGADSRQSSLPQVGWALFRRLLSALLLLLDNKCTIRYLMLGRQALLSH